jgi:alanyl-tRNA synthetase
MSDTFILRQLKEVLSTREEDIVKTVERFKKELEESRKDITRLKKALEAL